MISENKKIVEKYIEGFRRTDNAMILSCLTDDVEWIMHGAFHHSGKKAFDSEIENEAFIGKPILTINRMTEENNVVVCEGTVQAKKRDGGILNGLFCDVFEMRNEKISKLTTYMAILNNS